MGGLLICCKKETKPTASTIEGTEAQQVQSNPTEEKKQLINIQPVEEDIKIYDKYKFENDSVFEKIESKKHLNILGDMDYSDFLYSLSEFSISQATVPDDYSKKPLSYSKNDVWFKEDMSESLFQSFIENKVYKHPKIYTRAGENEQNATIFKDILLNMYKSLDQKLKQSNKEKNIAENGERIKKFHIVAFGLLYCCGKSVSKIHSLFELFKENDQLSCSEEFKDFLLALFLIPAYCLFYARKKAENYDEVGGAFNQNDMKATLDTMQLKDSVHLVEVACKQIFGEDNHSLTYDQFKEMFKNEDGIAYLIQAKGVRELLFKNNV